VINSLDLYSLHKLAGPHRSWLTRAAGAITTET